MSPKDICASSIGDCGKLLNNAGLANARVASKQDQPAVTGFRISQGRGQFAQLALSTYEARRSDNVGYSRI
jgi:hypothetical protein